MPVIANYLRRGNVDFATINQAALGYLPSLVRNGAPRANVRPRMAGAKPDATG